MKIPGVEGEYGVTAGHTPIISQLKPGVVSIVHDAVSHALMSLTHAALQGRILLVNEGKRELDWRLKAPLGATAATVAIFFALLAPDSPTEPSFPLGRARRRRSSL